jgi:segregation and condensation protein B
MPDDDPPHLPLPNLAGEWQLDAEPDFAAELLPDPEPEPAPDPPPVPPLANPFPSTVLVEETPPSPEQIVEALLFAGGPALTAEKACEAVRGLTPEAFRLAVDALNKSYRTQNRPYAVVPRDTGFVLAVRPGFRTVKERLFGGPKETRLTQPALDVLSLVAYRQPVGKADVDAWRGADSGGLLRQLVRLGLVAVTRRAAGETPAGYGTTPRFLELFGLASVDDLPRPGESVQMGG